ncbi:MAG: hypothetical protein JW925_09190 [Syntrophaceae bacterium]|nr:hypothetical protein [Syntrophaceae bacterium]
MLIENNTNNKKRAYLEENYGRNILPLSMIENACFPGHGPIEIFLYYKKETPVEKLKASLWKAAEHYNIFSSRLIMIDDNKFALQYCTDSVVIKILPPVDVASDNINIDDIKKMMIHVQTLPGEPLFVVTGIPLKDGILGAISCSHALVDGISLMLFLYVWGCIIEGRDFPRPSPQRLFKGNPVRFDEIDKIFIPPLSELSPAIQHRVQSARSIKTYTTGEYLSDEFIHEIKNQSQTENAEHVISDNQIITAFLLKKYHDVLLPDADKIKLITPVDLRNVHSGIDAIYMGNAVITGIAEFTKDEIRGMSLHRIAWRIKQSVVRPRDENAVKEISYLSEHGVEFSDNVLKNHIPPDMERDIVSINLIHLNDLDSLGLGADIGSILYVSSGSVQANFTMLKEKRGRIFVQITGRYPFV